MTEDDTAAEQRAKRRLWSLSLIRLLGMALALAGVAMWQQGLFGVQDELGGKLVTLAGIGCMFLVPALLRRKWREDR